MTRKMKAILVLFFAAEIVNSAKVGVLKGRIADLEDPAGYLRKPCPELA